MFDTPLGKIGLIVVGAIVGWCFNFITTKLSNRRGVVAVRIKHQRLGFSARDDVYGDLEVTWRGTVLQSVWHTDVELENISGKDFSDVTVKIFAGDDTRLLSGNVIISDTIDPVVYTNEFQKILDYPEDGKPTETQIRTYFSSRYYLVKNFNRGQKITGTYISDLTAKDLTTARIFVGVSISHPGLRIKFKSDPFVKQTIFGVPTPHAALAGVAIALIFWGFAVSAIPSSWYLSLACLILGIVVALPGALIIRTWRWINRLLTG